MEDNRDDIAGWRTAWFGAQIHIYGCKGRSIYLSLPNKEAGLDTASEASFRSSQSRIRPPAPR